jgi:hypothetical protein
MRLEFENLASQVMENFRRIKRLEDDVASLRKTVERQFSGEARPWRNRLTGDAG